MGDRMTPGLLRVCSAAALAAGSVGVTMPASAACEVRYSAFNVSFIGCAAEERACEAGGYIYGTTGFAQCVAALSGHVMQVPERRALGFRPATPPAGMRQTAPPLPPLAPPLPPLAPPLPPLAPNRQP